VNALPVSLYFPIEDGVFVPGQHLLLGRHLLLPRLHLLQALAQARERGVDGGHNVIDAPEASTVTVFLVSREAPWDFPAES
jgi:hypothetical protein